MAVLHQRSSLWETSSICRSYDCTRSRIGNWKKLRISNPFSNLCFYVACKDCWVMVNPCPYQHYAFETKLYTVGDHLPKCVGTRGCLYNWIVLISETRLFKCKADYFSFNAQQNIIILEVRITEDSDKWLSTVIHQMFQLPFGGSEDTNENQSWLLLAT